VQSDVSVGQRPFAAPDADAAFEALRRKLVALWQSIQSINQEPQTIVVVPSLNVDSVIEGIKLQAYEER
jgi:hypothetical protein